jgi:hypothetical protein
MKTASSVLILLLLFACGQPQKTESQKDSSAAVIPPLKEQEADTIRQGQPSANPHFEKANISVKTFQNNADNDARGTWGYDVYVDTSRYITQPSIPSVPGNKGFSSEARARKAGEFVAYKVKHNIMPPAVTPAELDSLGVLH